MPKRYAVVDNTTNVVVNVILWDGVAQWAPPAGTTAHPSNTANIGDTWANQP